MKVGSAFLPDSAVSPGSFWLRLAFGVGCLGLRLRPIREMRLLKSKGGTFMSKPYNSLSSGGSGLRDQGCLSMAHLPGDPGCGDYTSLKHTSTFQVYKDIPDLHVQDLDVSTIDQLYASAQHCFWILFPWGSYSAGRPRVLLMEGRCLRSSVSCSLPSVPLDPPPAFAPDTHTFCFQDSSLSLFSQRVHFYAG